MQTTSQPAAKPSYRYEILADFITSLVDDGVLRPGMRAPSLRKVSEQHGASLSTALQAYRLLEDRGVLEARPKSGFYVSAKCKVSLKSPTTSKPPRRATHVSISRSILDLMMQFRDPNLVPLGVAIPSPELLAAGSLDRFLARTARTKGAQYNLYTQPQGDPDLRFEIARRSLRWGHAQGPEDMVITCGCTEALSLALRAVTKPGDTVAIESPTYFGLLLVLEALGLKALELPTDASDGLDLSELESALERKRCQACLFTSSFNNPLGFVMSEEKKRSVLKLLNRHQIPLIEDDVYGDIHFGAERPRPFMALDPAADVIYCSSFSKTVAPGYRIGWVASSRYGQAMVEDKLAQTLSGPALPQAALAAFLSSGGYDNHLRRLRRALTDHIDRMARTIDRCFPDETRMTRPAGGFVVWLELPKGIDSIRLSELAHEKGISIAPGTVFSPTDRFKNCIRLSCGHTWNSRIEQGVEALGELVKSQL